MKCNGVFEKVKEVGVYSKNLQNVLEKEVNAKFKDSDADDDIKLAMKYFVCKLR